MVTYSWRKFDIALLVWCILFTFNTWMVTNKNMVTPDRGQPPTKCLRNGADKEDIFLFLLSATSYT